MRSVIGTVKEFLMFSDKAFIKINNEWYSVSKDNADIVNIREGDKVKASVKDDVIERIIRL